MNSYEYWSYVLGLIQQSLYAEQMVCSMSTQLFVIPETKDLEGNPEMHEHLEEAAYHRVTAAGSTTRLQLGEYHESIIIILNECVQKSLEHDKDVRKWLDIMKDNAPENYKQFLQQIIVWQEQTNYYLKMAQSVITQQTVNQ